SYLLGSPRNSSLSSENSVISASGRIPVLVIRNDGVAGSSPACGTIALRSRLQLSLSSGPRR
ncbi:MAG TPA: hypothetical protein VLW88_06285, partial [Hyphomicrobium sp.]|nr:hypothetical protein [Hyphomicrobium sp.]